MNEADALKLMQRVVEKVLPNVLQKMFNNFRTGNITGITNSITAEVALDNGTRISGVRLPKGNTASVGDTCVVFSINSNNTGTNFVVGVY